MTSQCSKYGFPVTRGTGTGALAQANYSDFPKVDQRFYQKPSSDLYNNMTSQNKKEAEQLNLMSMMPASWKSSAATAASGERCLDDWSRYSVSKEGALKYIQGSGAARFGTLSRSGMTGRKLGITNLLRSQPQPALTIHPEAVVFGDSSYRQAIVNPRVSQYTGGH
jgi:hypothetical protein